MVIRDEFQTLEDVQEAIKKQGLETCSLIFVTAQFAHVPLGQAYLEQFTKKNKISILMHRQMLSHGDDKGIFNYAQVICILGETLEPFDEDGIIPVFGFGDGKCRDISVFELKPGVTCDGFSEVLDVYNEVTPTIKLGGPTSFAPLIEKAIDIVKETNEYHILVIVADGQLTIESPTEKAFIEASKYPLSVVVVGVGDGPWGAMIRFDDELPEREFDNFQFLNFHEVMTENPENNEAAFALHALMEIPEQYNYLKRRGLIK